MVYFGGYYHLIRHKKLTCILCLILGVALVDFQSVQVGQAMYNRLPEYLFHGVTRYELGLV